MTQRERAIYEKYQDSNITSLRGLYATFSAKKEEAWDHCHRLCYNYNGRNLKIIGGGSHLFSAGFEYTENGTPMFMHITKYGAHPIVITE